MIYTIIASNDIEWIKEILNTIVNKFNDINVEYIANTKEEMLKIISQNSISLIIVDFRFSKTKITEIIKQIKGNSKEAKNDILIISEEKILYKSIDENIEELNAITSKKRNIYDILTKIVTNNKKNDSEIRHIITEELLNRGYNIKCIGTYYIREAISIIYESNQWEKLDNLERNVYNIIAHKHQKSINNIKTNIVKSTNSRKKNNTEVDNYTPKMIISDILTKIM